MPIEHIQTLREGGSDEKDKLVLADPTTLPAWDAGTELQVVGKRHVRVDGPEKVTGRAQYAYDIRLPGQLYAAVLRSPHPHARITHIDTSAAEALEGVHAVLSSANAPDITWYEEECPLFAQVLRFVGDEVAAVAAESEEIAEDALRLIRVEYEPLPFVANLERALAPDAPPVHQQKDAPQNHVDDPKEYERGKVESGLEQADAVIDQVYTTQTAVHNSLEPHGCTAVWEGERLTLWSSTQGIFQVREDVAGKLGIPEHDVRIIKQYMGGGFGSKQVAWKESVIAALLARRSGRPVQLMLSREAENLAAGNRNATRQHVRLGATKDGTLTAISLDAHVEVGAYMVGGEASNVSGIYQRLYRCDNVKTVQANIYTNTGPAVAFRAPGYVEAAYALESAMDELAVALKMDPIELRRRNYAETDQKKEQPYTSPDALRLCYEKAADAFGWTEYERPAPQGSKQSSNQGSKRRGIGFAAHEWGGAGNPPGYAWVKLNGDGSADVITGTQDIGTGSRTGLVQVAAEELGLPVSCINIQIGDTAAGPYSPTSAGSATLSTVGPAVREAAANARQQLLKAAAMVLEEKPEDMSVQDGKIFAKADPNRSVTVAEVCKRAAPYMIQGHGARTQNIEGKSIRTFGAQCVEVEVDVETGEVTVLNVVATHDCGRIVNPTMVDSQIIGGITQGVGFALTEERIVDPMRGVVLNANLEEYKVPTVADIPTMTHAALGVPDPEANPLGVKGIGEPPLIPTAPAIANAVFDAVGVRVRQAPISRRRLVELLAQQDDNPGDDTREGEEA